MSLGGACACSKSLRKAKMQFASFPFDWLNGATFRDRSELLAEGFDAWLSEGLDKTPEPPLCVGESHWRDRKYGFGLLHDFDRLTPLEEALPDVKAKYARRAAHLFDLIGRAKKVLLVWTDVPTSPDVTEEDIARLLSVLREKWPDVQFDFLLFRRQPGVPFEKRTDEEKGAVRIVTFDYMIQEISKYGVLLADDDLLGQWLSTQYEVPDYRTPEEVARWKRVSRLNKYKEFGGHGLLSYLIGKMQYKIYKHFMKKLQRKGIPT